MRPAVWVVNTSHRSRRDFWARGACSSLRLDAFGDAKVHPRTYLRAGVPGSGPKPPSSIPGSSLSLCICGTSFWGELGRPYRSSPSVDPPGIGPRPRSADSRLSHRGPAPGRDPTVGDPSRTGPRAPVSGSPARLHGSRGVSEGTRRPAGVRKSDTGAACLTDSSLTGPAADEDRTELFVNAPVISRKAGISAASLVALDVPQLIEFLD